MKNKNQYTHFSFFFKHSFLMSIWLLGNHIIVGSCPSATPWTTPVALTRAGNVTSNIYSAATPAGFMAVWSDSANNGYYAFSSSVSAWANIDVRF